MSIERAFELLSAELDNDLSPDEQEELRGLLADSAEARELASELSQLDQTLDKLPNVDPPAGLADQILGALRTPEPTKRVSLFDWLSSIGAGPMLRYGFSVAVGALLAIAVYENQPEGGTGADITELVGTMAPDADRPGRRILDSLSFEQTGVSSVARLERRDRSLVIDIRIDTTRIVEIAMDFDATKFEFEALAQTQSSLDAIEWSGTTLRVKGRGQRRFAVLLRPVDDEASDTETQIRLDYSSEGKILQQGTLDSDG